MWRIEDFKPVKQPAQSLGRFYIGVESSTPHLHLHIANLWIDSSAVLTHMGAEHDATISPSIYTESAR